MQWFVLHFNEPTRRTNKIRTCNNNVKTQLNYYKTHKINLESRLSDHRALFQNHPPLKKIEQNIVQKGVFNDEKIEENVEKN